MSASDAPLWLRAIVKLERTIGEPVELAVRSDVYFDLVSHANRLQSTVKGTAEGISRRCLHLLNLPAGSDVRRLREQLSRMERRLEHLTEVSE
jgi:hypothetical protein